MANQDQGTTNPATPKAWKKAVEEKFTAEYRRTMKLQDLCSWKVNGENPSGSRLSLENFLHFRALIVNHSAQLFQPKEYIRDRCADAAAKLLKPGGWPNSELGHYLAAVGDRDPDLDTEDLGPFAAAKVTQNHIHLSGNQQLLGKDAGGNVNDDDGDDQPATETPVKRPPQGPKQQTSSVPKNVSVDEMVVNQAVIEYLTATSREWMYRRTAAASSPSQRSPTLLQKNGALARWTIQRNRFHIKVAGEAHSSTSQVSGKATKTSKNSGDGFIRVLETLTDGHLYHTTDAEVLALIEVKARYREKAGYRIEWQETAEILAWLNLRIRTEKELALSRSSRKGLLRAPSGKFR